MHCICSYAWFKCVRRRMRAIYKYVCLRQCVLYMVGCVNEKTWRCINEEHDKIFKEFKIWKPYYIYIYIWRHRKIRLLRSKYSRALNEAWYFIDDIYWGIFLGSLAYITFFFHWKLSSLSLKSKSIDNLTKEDEVLPLILFYL